MQKFLNFNYKYWIYCDLGFTQIFFTFNMEELIQFMNIPLHIFDGRNYKNCFLILWNKFNASNNYFRN